MKHIAFFVLSLITISSYAQLGILETSVQSSTFISSGESLPFWMTQNQQGKYAFSGNVQMLNEAEVVGEFQLSSKLDLQYGADLSVRFSDEKTKLRIQEAWTGINSNHFKLTIGTFADDEVFGGLSSTNGELVSSLNYRPYPRIRFSTNGYIPFLASLKWFSFSAEYNEGFLLDNRVVDDAHLHHKSLMLQFLTGENSSLTIGGTHYVFWGGYWDGYGWLPDGLSDYFTYITGSKGTDDFYVLEQENVAGNQLGTYRISYQQSFKIVDLELRINHPFEDHSGMRLKNLKDNQYTVYLKRKEGGTFLDEIILEYLYTKHQSGDRHDIYGPGEHLVGADNYFNNYLYGSGFSYYGYCLGTPFIYPLVTNDDGVTTGFENNRVSAWHVGAKGFLTDHLSWEAMVSYTRNFGRHYYPYPEMKEQLYSIGELSWESNKLPIQFSAYLAVDSGELVEDQLGAGFSVKWNIR